MRELLSWLPAILSFVSTVGVVYLGNRYRQAEQTRKEDASLKGKELDDRARLTAQILEELGVVKLDRDKAYAEINLLNQKLLAAERINVELAIELQNIKKDLERLRQILSRIDPSSVSRGCKLFGTAECPFTRVKDHYDATFGDKGGAVNGPTETK